MKSMWPPLTAIFFMTYLYRAGGGGPWPPRHPRATNKVSVVHHRRGWAGLAIGSLDLVKNAVKHFLVDQGIFKF